MTEASRDATGQELAQLLGLTIQNVRRHADEAHIIRSKTKGKYLFEESVQGYCKHLRGMAARHGDPGSAIVLSKERARLAQKQGDLAVLKAEQIRGELVSAVEVESRWRSTLTALRSRLLAVPSRLLSRQPHLTKAEIAALEIEIRDALTELSNGS